MPVVAVVAAGNMGAAVGRRLTESGVEVLTVLAGRRAASVARAEAAGMTDVPLAGLAAAEVVLSILPPGQALSFARQMVPVTYPLLTMSGQVPNLYRDIARYPAMFLIDREGRLQTAPGPDQPFEEVQAAVDRLLKTGS